MTNTHGMKLLYIIINMGFGSQAVEIAHQEGAVGAVIIKAAGTTGMVRESLLDIPVETKKEIVLAITSEEIAQKVMAAIKENVGIDSPAHGICLTLPIGAMTPLDLAVQ